MREGAQVSEAERLMGKGGAAGAKMVEDRLFSSVSSTSSASAEAGGSMLPLSGTASASIAHS